MSIELKNKLLCLNSRSLVSDLKELIPSERRLKSEILHYLWVIQAKRIFAELGYPSLFEFCLRHLGYTEAESQRRISSARLLGELPAIEEKINDGSLSQSSLALAQSLFRQEAKNETALSEVKKIEVLKCLENKSVRECEREILKFSSSKLYVKTQDKITVINEDLVQVSFTAPKEFLEKLDRLKALNSNKNPSASIFELLSELVNNELKGKAKKNSRKRTRSEQIEAGLSHRDQPNTQHGPRDQSCRDRSDIEHCNREQSEVRLKQATDEVIFCARRTVSVAQQVKTKNAVTPKTVSRKAVPSSMKQKIWSKYNSQCSYKDSLTGQKCGSRYFLEIEHIIPRAHGGQNEEENLKLYCKVHNQLAAINEFGFSHMNRFINKKTNMLLT